MSRRSRIALLMTTMGMITVRMHGQALFSPRNEAMASSSALVSDIRGFTANPAGLTGMKGWDVIVGTSLTPQPSGGGFVFEGVAFGRRFLDRHALAFQYTPGALLETVQPASSVVAGFTIPTNRVISFAEPVAAAYAFRWNDGLAIGVQGRARTEKVADPQYEYLIQDTSIVSVQHEFKATSWFVDIGAQWEPEEWLRVSALGRGLIQGSGSSIPADYASFRLPHPRSGEIDVAGRLNASLWCSAGATTDGLVRVGAEWNPAGTLSLRAGAYASRSEKPFVFALSAGAGWSYAFFDIDASYLRFTAQDNRQGVVSAAIFDPSTIHDIRLSPYTRDRIAVAFRAVFGNLKESLARIEGVQMLGGIYPSSAEALAFKPVGNVHVKNVSNTPIQARATFYVDQYMDQPTESQQVTIAPGEVAVIPMTAVFNDRVRSVPKSMIKDGTVAVTATVAEEFDDRTQTRVLIHGKNDWDGDVHSLRYFVTPDDPEIIRYSRDVLLSARDSVVAGPKALNAFRNAKILFTSIAGKMTYVSDPMQSADYVQYPVETLTIRGGDCDDMTVCFASLLSSVGIGTAFVDVVPPGHPEKAHVYLMFDSGVPPSMGELISSNNKRFVTRRSKSGDETLWIPVETTVVTKGFEQAWEQGAREFFEDVEVQLGLIRGWVNIVDVY